MNTMVIATKLAPRSAYHGISASTRPVVPRFMNALEEQFVTCPGCVGSYDPIG
jgi:hypothetical protein